MNLNKRDLFKLAGSALGAAAVGSISAASASASEQDTLTDITGDVSPISREERLARVARAQALMQQQGIDAILLEPGSAMLYFTGIRWWRSERLTAVVIPREGDIGVVTPFFEEPSVRESMTFGDDVRPWHEHESPFKQVASILKDRGIVDGKLGLEDTVRYFVVDGLKKDAPGHSIVSALPITLGCRMFKSAHELTLMRKANEITLRAYGEVWDKLDKGMTPADVNDLMRSAQAALGGQGIWNMALFGEASAYPHGTSQPQEIKDGQIVLMDCGCNVHGYQSDISRTFVYGEPSKRQREVWNNVRKGQQIAFEKAQIGTPAGQVDDAVRAYYETLGYGPGYKTPGLSHRTGHGIGMDGHESVNFVHGETTKLATGMCFSNEPGIYIFGEFGVRLEDCIYMTDTGPKWFTTPPGSLDDPVGSMGA
ncbi:metallopeptidase [Kordiimonas sediminis]|uniref:Metallopeptidase n=1 Tax=Kordiimonas sediminis TaxID=1735581 RepID=A0A919AJY8_9PROT|nr:Xaa-Pro peptidase family protein [Kordiimonas sediminis]GHF12122.1 metallopeptidase [Kordiimonas sediminis]